MPGAWHRQGVQPASSPARQRSLRDHNLALALQVVAQAAQPVSRAQIAVATGVTRATASALVEELLTAGLVQEVALPRTAKSGRPATGITLSGALGGLGLEINVDHLTVTVVDLTGDVVHEQVVTGDLRGRPAPEVLREAGLLARRAVRTGGLRLTGAAVAVPGLLDGDRLLAPNLGWRNVDVRRHLRIGLPMTLDNEANFAALAEVTAQRQSFLHVSADIGIGAGIVIDGRLFRGARGWSGEIGHIPVDPTGPLCRCGARGCLEVFAGHEALATRGPAAVGTALGTALAGVLNVLDIGTVVLGGVYAEHAPGLVPGISAELRRRVLWADLKPPEVLVGRYGTGAAALGAATSVVRDTLAFAS
jgi:predicted NBD/HSP70 family sugar kinase